MPFRSPKPAFAFAAIIGIFFALYAARKAPPWGPMEALRYA